MSVHHGRVQCRPAILDSMSSIKVRYRQEKPQNLGFGSTCNDSLQQILAITVGPIQIKVTAQRTNFL